MVSGQAEGNPAEPGHVARLWVWGQAAVSVMTAFAVADGDVLAGERLELGGQVAGAAVFVDPGLVVAGPEVTKSGIGV